MKRHHFIQFSCITVLFLSFFATSRIYSQCSTNTDAQWYINESLYGSTRNVSFYNYGSFKISPNPSSNSISVDLNPDLTFDIEIINFSGFISKQIKTYNIKDKIDVSTLIKGDYVA